MSSGDLFPVVWQTQRQITENMKTHRRPFVPVDSRICYDIKKKLKKINKHFKKYKVQSVFWTRTTCFQQETQKKPLLKKNLYCKAFI